MTLKHVYLSSHAGLPAKPAMLCTMQTLGPKSEFLTTSANSGLHKNTSAVNCDKILTH